MAADVQFGEKVINLSFHFILKVTISEDQLSEQKMMEGFLN